MCPAKWLRMKEVSVGEPGWEEQVRGGQTVVQRSRGRAGTGSPMSSRGQIGEHVGGDSKDTAETEGFKQWLQ